MKVKKQINRNFFLHKETQEIYMIEYQADGTIIGSYKAKEPLKDLKRYKCKSDKNVWIQNNRDKFEPFTDSSRTEKLELMRQGHKLRVELFKYKNKVKPDVWVEIEKEVKRLRSGISLVPGAAIINGEHVKKENHPEIFTPDYEGVAKRIRKEAQEIVSGREVFGCYENMGFNELAQAWQTIPEINNEFQGVWAFIHFMAKIFPNSQAQELAKKKRPLDYPQQEKGGEGKNWHNEDSTERQNLMAITIIPKYFDVTEKTLRRRTGEGKRFKNYPDANGTMRLDTTLVAQYYARLTDSKKSSTQIGDK